MEQKHLRVLVIAYNTIPRAGWGRYADAMVRGMRAQAIDVHAVVADRKEGDTAPLLVPEKAPFSMIRNILLVRRLAKECDIVHAFDVWRFGVYGYFAVAGTGKKFFMTGVGTYSMAPPRYSIAHPRDSLKRLLFTLAINRAKAIFCISSYTKKRMYDRIHSANLLTNYWGTSPISPLPSDRSAEFRKEYAIPHGAGPVLLTVGQIKHRKGQQNVANAVLKLRERYPNIFYAIVGSDSNVAYCNSLRSFIKAHGLEDNIRLYSNVASDEGLSFFYGFADLFIMASNNDGPDHYEGFGLVFLEAEQFGKPVIGSRDCGIEDALQDGYNGYLTNQGDDDDIAQKISLVIEGDREAFAKNSKDFANRFRWEKTVRECIEQYRS